jgi:hypothetical protein
MSLFDDYRNSSDDRKTELLDEIEFEDIPEKWNLLRTVIADPNEYDLARIQALKILEIAKVPDADRPSFCDLLARIIKTDEDYDVKNYAVMAAKNFVNDSAELKELIIKAVLDPKEDIDIRHNAYRAVLSLWDLPGRKVVLEKLSSDQELGRMAVRDLASFERES